MTIGGGVNTNLERVFDTLLEYHDPEDENKPHAVMIVSDMEFDEAVGKENNETNFNVIDRKFRERGLERPVIIFWRVDVKNEQQPVYFDERGVIMINGYSPNVMGLIMSMDIEELKEITPEKMMFESIEKYEDVLKSCEFLENIKKLKKL
jgi:hypothetical protein